MPIFMDSGPISTNLGILGFPIFVSRDSGPWILDFSGSEVWTEEQLRAKPALWGVKIFKNGTPLDFKSKEGRDFQKNLKIIYCLS